MMRLAVSFSAAVLTALSLPAIAKVSQQEADRLGKELTPLGAERAANAKGTIPEWTGGLLEGPSNYKGREVNDRLRDPYPNDKPLYTITAQNVEQYKHLLPEGHLKLFELYPNTYKMPVYPSRRTAASPQFVYDATKKNALQAELGGGGEALVNAITGIPFPIPKSGFEPIWNHKVRYRGLAGRRWNVQFAVTQGGDYNAVKLREDVYFPYSSPDATPEGLDNVILYFLQVITDPPRLAGTITLVHETMDQVAEPRRAWQFNPGQRRLRRAPNVGYDNPGNGSDGLRTNDQTDMFNGAMDRYTWKLVGKREMIIPYNAYKLHSDEYKYRDIIQPGHINQDLTRYELHRVWVVDSETKEGTSHIYKRRVFYVDEDSWGIALVDVYDKRDELWRFQEAHFIQGYHPTNPVSGTAGETIYDLQSGRYLVQAVNNEEEESYQAEWDTSYFNPGSVSKLVKR